MIENVVTHADVRNRDHGKAILTHAMDQAWSQRCYKVMLLTGRTDEATLRFYAGAGFMARGIRHAQFRGPLAIIADPLRMR